MYFSFDLTEQLTLAPFGKQTDGESTSSDHFRQHLATAFGFSNFEQNLT